MCACKVRVAAGHGCGGDNIPTSPCSTLSSLPQFSLDCKVISFLCIPSGFSHHSLNINSILTSVGDEGLMHCVSLELAVSVEVQHFSSL